MKHLVIIILFISGLGFTGEEKSKHVEKVAAAFNKKVKEADRERDAKVKEAAKKMYKDLEKIKVYHTKRGELEKALEAKVAMEKIEDLVNVPRVEYKSADEVAEDAKQISSKRKLIIFNSHDHKNGNRGIKKMNVLLMKGKEVVETIKNVRVRWSDDKNDKTTLNLPKSDYDSIKLEITEFEGSGPAIAEIEIHEGKNNIAPTMKITASKNYGPCKPEAMIDGITKPVTRPVGYWMGQPSNDLWILLKF